MGEEDNTYYKIVFLGNVGVGKTHLLYRYTKGILPAPASATLCVGYTTRSVPLFSGGSVQAQLWDSAGQEQYQSITWTHYRNASAALFVYDITDLSSFEAIYKWKKQANDNLDEKLIGMLIGNKADLVEHNPAYRSVAVERAQAFARENHLLFKETSALSGLNVKEAFEEIVQAVHNQKHQVHSTKGVRETVGYSLEKLPRLEPNNSCCS